MSIPALLLGCSNAIQTAFGQTVTVGPRIIDGAPWGAYKRGMGWYVGVYFAGSTMVGGESYYETYSLGIDLTRVLTSVPTAKKGEWFLQDKELFDMAGRLSQLMLAGRGKIATACNAALAGTWEDGRGVFREQFHTGNRGKASEKGPEWILGEPSERQTGAIIIIPQTFTGLRWWKKLEETFEGDS